MNIVQSPSLRISLGLLSLSLSLLLAADLLFGVFPLDGKDERQRRAHVAQQLASRVAEQYAASDSRLPAVLPELLRIDTALRSIGLRRESGELVAASPEHESVWRSSDTAAAGQTQFTVAMTARPSSTPWGHVEVAFHPMTWSAWWSPPVRMLLFFSAGAALFFSLYLRRAFQYLDPGRVVPQRVQMAFDALSEGVIVLDHELRIVMSNKAFNALCPDEIPSLMGRQPQKLQWLRVCRPGQANPWVTCMQPAGPNLGVEYEATSPASTPRKLIVNSSPVLDDKGQARGCVVSFTDVTAIDAAHRKLVEVMDQLRCSKEQLEEQNAELKRMATEDPLTGTMNRRAFFPLLESLFEKARRHGTPLTVLMADIDKFKAINDVYGHAAGDRVIQGFSAILKRGVRHEDVICRYGGEEFCIALPGADARLAAVIADRLCAMTAAELGRCVSANPPIVTASFGIADLGAATPHAPGLVDQADQALYLAKRSGRNRVVEFGPEGVVAGAR